MFDDTSKETTSPPSSPSTYQLTKYLSILQSLYESLCVPGLALKSHKLNQASSFMALCFPWQPIYLQYGSICSLMMEKVQHLPTLYTFEILEEKFIADNPKNRRKKKVGGKSWRVAASQLPDWRDAVVAKTRQNGIPFPLKSCDASEVTSASL